jgi:hypothetical protein
MCFVESLLESCNTSGNARACDIRKNLPCQIPKRRYSKRCRFTALPANVALPRWWRDIGITRETEVKKAENTMKTRKIAVEQEGIRSVVVRRTVVLEVPENVALDPTWIRRDIAQDEKDYGPFPWEPVEGTESLEPVRTRVVRFTEQATDIPFVDELPFLESTNSVEKSEGLGPLGEPSVASDARVFRGEGTGVSEELSLDFGRYKGRPIKKVPTRVLKRFHGELQGRNDVIADELRRRGLNSRELQEGEPESVATVCPEGVNQHYAKTSDGSFPFVACWSVR